MNRRERKARTNAKLAAVSADDAAALLVKAADRLANLRASAGGGAGSKLDMYRREHPTFRAAVYRPGLCDAEDRAEAKRRVKVLRELLWAVHLVEDPRRSTS